MKKTMFCLIVAMVFVPPFLLNGYAGNDLRIGSAGAQELLIPVGARGIALGQSSLVVSTGVDAIYWNPAGLSRETRGVEALFSHMQYFGDIAVNYGAIGFQAGDVGTIGVSLKSISFGDIPVTTEDFIDGTGATFSPTFINLGATYSKLLTDRISVGVTSTLISEKIINTSASGVAFNVGIQYYGLGIPELSLGIAVKNVGPLMSFSGSDLLRTANVQQSLRGNQPYLVDAAGFALPSSMEIGLGYQRKLDDQNSVLFGGNFQNNNTSDDVYGLGGEYNYDNTFYVRASYLYAPQRTYDVSGQSSYIYDYALGAGLRHDVGGVDVTFDYAYRHVKLLDANNIITIRFGF